MSLPVLVLILSLTACAGVRLAAPPIHAEAGLAFDRNGVIASFADGIADPGNGRRITIDDPVRVASISKMVTAIGVMKLVDERRIDLNSDASKWLGWTLRNPNFPDQPITISMLLSHTSSIREHDDDYVIPLVDRFRPRWRTRPIGTGSTPRLTIISATSISTIQSSARSSKG
ncbi:MAG TPA: serine hydrolase domain-containing protein [Sphingomicrobium sp.]|nr:serine hydrolase domain-containing protein [Sphingomicrobium sp.]